MRHREPDIQQAKPAAKIFGVAAPDLNAFSRIAKAILTRRVRIDGWRVVFSSGTSATGKNSKPRLTDVVAPKHLMRIELTALLDSVPDSRRVLRHLAAVEHGLKHKDAGGIFLYGIPVDRLRKVRRQLDGMCPPDPTPGLAALRECMLAAAKSQIERARNAEDSSQISTFMVDHKMQVLEGNTSDFDQMHAEWQRTAPAPLV